MANTVSGGNNLLDASKVLKRAGLAQGMKVGDFGCGGLGYFSLTAAGMVGAGGMVYAVDILKTVLRGVEERARTRRLDNLKTVWSNLEVFGATKIEDGSLDLGLLVNILFQTDEAEAIIKECTRMIKPGGKLLVVDWKLEGVPFGPLKEERVSEAEVRQMAGALGWREIESFEAGPYHWATVFVK